jgi:hypothetical protein
MNKLKWFPISNGQELNLILKINSQCDVKHILTSPIKKNNASFEDFDIHYH